MSYPLVRECIAPGVYFSAITDKKFKHNRISVNLIVKLDRQKVTDRAVVPFILRQGSKNCPDFTQLNKRLCDLYGASLDAGVDKFGEYQVIALGVVGIDNRFALQGEDMVRACAQLLCEIVLEPNITDSKFDEKNTQLEKQYLLDTIEAEINDKRTYASIRCKDVMFGGEGCAIKKYGYREDAEKITSESAAKAYEELIRTAQIEIMFEGCGDPSAAKALFEEKFASLVREPISVDPSCARLHHGETKQETEQMDVKQGKLVMGFWVDPVTDYREANRNRIAVALFGGTANSLLFKNVREKLSLCYYCSASYDRISGIMLVASGVEAPNAQKTRDEVMHQLSLLQSGAFTDQELEETKLYIRTALKATTDSLSAMDSWYLTQTLGQTAVSPDAEIALSQEVTREDILKAANAIHLDTVYMLMPKDKPVQEEGTQDA